MTFSRRKSSFIFSAVLSAAAVLVTACLGRGTDEASIYGPRPRFANREVGFMELKTAILEPYCVRCHKWAQSEDGLARFLVAGDPAVSELYQRVLVTTRIGRMPKDAPPLSAGQVAMIQGYIQRLGRPVDPRPSPSPSPSPSPTPVLEPTFRSLKFHLFDASCVTCHHAGVPSRIPVLETVDQVRSRADDIMTQFALDAMPPFDSGIARPRPEVISTFEAWVDAGMPE